MQKVTNIRKTRNTKNGKSSVIDNHDGFIPCSQDMTICGDCEGNRAKQNCPRLKEWTAKKTD